MILAGVSPLSAPLLWPLSFLSLHSVSLSLCFSCLLSGEYLPVHGPHWSISCDHPAGQPGCGTPTPGSNRWEFVGWSPAASRYHNLRTSCGHDQDPCRYRDSSRGGIQRPLSGRTWTPPTDSNQPLTLQIRVARCFFPVCKGVFFSHFNVVKKKQLRFQ